MIVNWLILIVLAALAASWIVYGVLKAFNGIVYEIGVLRRFLESGE